MTNLVAAAAAVVIQFAADPKDPARVTVSAELVPAGGSISLHLLDAETAKPGPAVFGDSERNGKRLSLRPRFGLSRGGSYSARVILPDGQVVIERHRIPDRSGLRVPCILTVYPRGESLPANLLKFYFYFSEPMREGRELFDLVHIVNEAGERVHSPWRRKELWDDDARRLTLWIHPGRIKRGVNLREAFGPVLEPDRNYRLVVDAGIRSGAGIPMGRRYVRRFRTGPEDRLLPDPRKWRIESPVAGTRHPVKIRSEEGFDHVLLARYQWIESPTGKRVPGSFEIEPGERSWSFKPEIPWVAGGYELCVDEWLEDLAGNTPTRPFERHVDSPEPRKGVTRVAFPAGNAVRP